MRQVLFFIVITVLIFGCDLKKTKQQNHPSEHVVAFYNLENLFDTINDPNIQDGEFTPEGYRNWDSEKYALKQKNMSTVIADIGNDLGHDGPSIIGLCEVENLGVLKDLIATEQLKNKGYAVVHQDSPDKRGIDVALLYKPEVFKVENKKLYPLFIYDAESNNRIFTRDQLLVSGKLEGETLHIIVNHWPSRYGGKERSIPSRKAAALLNRQIIDSLQSVDQHAKIITMGDLNDDPTDLSVTKYLDAHATKSKFEKGDLYNPLAVNFSEGNGTLYYCGNWNLFDQIIISQGLLNAKAGLKYDSAYIYKKPYLIQQDGDYKGYLLRTFGGKNYLKGYSDHLPVYMLLK